LTGMLLMALYMIMFLFTLLLGYAINKGRVVGYAKGQDEIIYLVSRTDVIHCGRLRYVFTDGHAIIKLLIFIII
ncbi:hypothetical protein ABEV13_10275, partial [Geobacillus stearothermophilus]